MPNSQIDNIVEDLFSAMPVIHRKLLNFLDESTSQGLSPYYFAILGMLSKADALAVSDIGKRLWISKPQMTAMIDKMVSLELVVRSPDVEDRRIIHISLTPKGNEFLNQAKDNIKKNIAEKVSHISREDLELLSTSLKHIKNIGSKLE